MKNNKRASLTGGFRFSLGNQITTIFFKSYLIKSILKYEFIEQFTLKDFLKLSLECKNNAIESKRSADLLLKNQSSKNRGLFFLYTSKEELQKAIFCMFVHRGFMKPKQILPIFSKHEVKIILFETIFENPKFCIKNGEFYVSDIPLQSIDLMDIADNNKKTSKKYMELRNDCLYVRPTNKISHNPSKSISDIDSRKENILDELSYLDAFFEFVWCNEYEGDLGNFYYYKVTPKDTPKRYHITFSGTGHVIKREKYKLEDLE